MSKKASDLIPKSMTARIRTKRIKKNSLPDAKPLKAFLNKNYYFCELPPLPKPSPELKQALIDLNDENPLDVSRKSKKRHLSSRNGRMNAFTAFRAFYSRSISSIERQRRLSTLLSKIWFDDPHKDVWKRYAFEYNNDNQLMDFVSWLCHSLNINSEKKVSNQYTHIDPTNPVDVEDVFIINDK